MLVKKHIVITGAAGSLGQTANKACFERIGPIYALFNIAGGFAMGTSASDPSDEQWELMFKLKKRGCEC